MHASSLSWILLLACLASLAVVDLLAFSKKGEEVSIRRAMAWTLIWSAIGVAFAGLVWAMGSAGAAGEYLAGYLIERSLSIDNVFVFALVFAAFSIPIADQDRPLLIGIIGALALRAIFIVLGAAALETFHWAVYVFGALLVIVAIRMATSGQGEVHPEHNPLVRLAGNNPKVAVLVAIMTADLVFAIDSIPAIFAITTDTFIVFAANAFSLLGMRPLYFLLAGAMDRFPYLKYGLAAVLAFVGAKMLATDIVHLPVWLSLVVIVLLLGLSIGVSLLRSPGRPQRV